MRTLHKYHRLAQRPNALVVLVANAHMRDQDAEPLCNAILQLLPLALFNTYVINVPELLQQAKHCLQHQPDLPTDFFCATDVFTVLRHRLRLCPPLQQLCDDIVRLCKRTTLTDQQRLCIGFRRTHFAYQIIHQRPIGTLCKAATLLHMPNPINHYCQSKLIIALQHTPVRQNSHPYLPRGFKLPLNTLPPGLTIPNAHKAAPRRVRIKKVIRKKRIQ